MIAILYVIIGLLLAAVITYGMFRLDEYTDYELPELVIIIAIAIPAITGSVLAIIDGHFRS